MPDDCSVTILDEADEMLREDWKDEVSKIMEGGGKLIPTIYVLSH